jgi:hypothetical protein
MPLPAVAFVWFEYLGFALGFNKQKMRAPTLTFLKRIERIPEIANKPAG